MVHIVNLSDGPQPQDVNTIQVQKPNSFRGSGAQTMYYS